MQRRRKLWHIDRFIPSADKWERIHTVYLQTTAEAYVRTLHGNERDKPRGAERFKYRIRKEEVDA